MGSQYFSRTTPIAFICIFLVTFFVYSPTLRNDFVNWDDDVHLLDNPFVHALDGKHIAAIFLSTVNDIYIPLTTLSFAIEYHFFRSWPLIYHLDNCILHGLVTSMVLLFALRCGLTLRASVIAALIFGLHPIHVESVAWVTERKDVLYSFFYMLALLLYCDYLDIMKFESAGSIQERGTPEGGRVSQWKYKKLLRLVLIILFSLLSILAKPMALSLPLIFGICDWYFKRKFSILSLLEKLSLTVFFLPILWLTYHHHLRVFNSNFLESFLIWTWCFGFYLMKFFSPDYFVVLYKLPSPVGFFHKPFLSSIFLFFIFFTSLYVSRKNRLFCFSFLFYFCSIFFLLRWDQYDTNIVADRFMYLPSLGLCLWLGIIFESIYLKWRTARFLKIVLISSGLIFLGLLVTKTYRQCQVWKNGVSLWQHQLNYRGEVATALVYQKLAYALSCEKDFLAILHRYRFLTQLEEKKLFNLDKSIQLEKDWERIEEVISLNEKAINIKPDFANAYYNLGWLYAELGKIELAKEYYEKTIYFNPKHFDAYRELGRLYLNLNKPNEAVSAFQKAIACNPYNEILCLQIIKDYQRLIRSDHSPEIYRKERDRLINLYNSLIGQ